MFAFGLKTSKLNVCSVHSILQSSRGVSEVKEKWDLPQMRLLQGDPCVPERVAHGVDKAGKGCFLAQECGPSWPDVWKIGLSYSVQNPL